MKSGSVLKVEVIKFAERLDVWCGRKTIRTARFLTWATGRMKNMHSNEKQQVETW